MSNLVRFEGVGDRDSLDIVPLYTFWILIQSMNERLVNYLEYWVGSLLGMSE